MRRGVTLAAETSGTSADRQKGSWIMMMSGRQRENGRQDCWSKACCMGEK